MSTTGRPTLDHERNDRLTGGHAAASLASPTVEHAELERRRLRAILDAIPAAVVLVESDHSFSYVNGHALDLFGSDLARLDLVSHLTRLKPLRADGTALALEEQPVVRTLVLGVEVFGEEMSIEDAAGARVPVLVSSAPLVSAAGEVTAAVVIYEDISAQKAAEKALRRSEERYRALAAENGRLYRQQLNIAESLQRALLNIPSEIGRVRVGHLYRSATDAAKVGGDFYDVFQVRQGKIAVLIGDVAGHGIEAARMATLVKDVVHAFLHQSLRVNSVLSRTNKVLIEKSTPGFVTLFLGIIDAVTGHFHFASAGHPLGFVRRASGQIDMIGMPSLPLGAYEDSLWSLGEVDLHPGDLVLLYTDGILEARRDSEFFGEQGLRSLLAQSAGTVEQLPQLILDTVLSFSSGRLNDDVAVLALALNGEKDAGPDEKPAD